MEKRKDLIVAALENGTVIDHIPTNKLFKVVQMLELDKSNDSVTIGNNYSSKLLGRKGLIKVADENANAGDLSAEHTRQNDNGSENSCRRHTRSQSKKRKK